MNRSDTGGKKQLNWGRATVAAITPVITTANPFIRLFLPTADGNQIKVAS